MSGDLGLEYGTETTVWIIYCLGIRLHNRLFLLNVLAAVIPKFTLLTECCATSRVECMIL